MTLRTVQTNGAEIVVEDTGADEPALVFLHYWGSSARTWAPVAACLPALVRKVLVNQRGWGGSVATDARYDLDSMAADVRAIIAHLGLRRVILVGHSMGGKVAQILAGAKHPGICGLVLVAPAPPTPMPMPEEVRRAMLRFYGSIEGVGRALDVLAGPNLTVEDRRTVVADTLSGAPGAKCEWTERGMIAELGIRPGDIGISVTLLVGSRDKVERSDQLRVIFGALVPQAHFVELPDVGHLAPLEAPAAVASACAAMLKTLAGA